MPLIATAAPVSFSMSTKDGSIRRPCVSPSAWRSVARSAFTILGRSIAMRSKFEWPWPK